jgi:hypothetical protein
MEAAAPENQFDDKLEEQKTVKALTTKVCHD